MENICLSVIIPAYNCALTISQTLDSILNQKCKELEIIIVNDGSTDNTELICKNYCKKYKNITYITKENSGVSETRNIGIKNAKGSYIAFLDADDVWDKNYYDDNLCNSLKKEVADLFVFSSCFTDNQLNIVERVNVKTQELFGGDKAVDTYYQSFCSFIYRRKLLLHYSLFFPTDIEYGEDEVFRSKCLYFAGKIIAENKMSFCYRNNPYSSTRMNRNYKRFAKQKLDAYYILKDFFFKQYSNNGESLIIKNGRTVSYFVNAISLLSEAGYGYKKIYNLCKTENINLMYDNNNKLYGLYYEIVDVMTEFIKYPLWAYLKRRLRGVWYYPAANLKHKFMKRKYNEQN